LDSRFFKGGAVLRLANLSPDVFQAVDRILNGFDGALIVDEKGYIVIITDKYANLANKKKDEVTGKHVLEVFPNSRMIEVISSGKPIYADLWEIAGETAFVSRVPIFWGGKIIGAAAVSVFRYMEEARQFAGRLQHMDSELKYYKAQVRKILGAKYSFDSIIGSSQAITGAKAKAYLAAKTRVPVLVVGETGSGKELFAHAIHQESSRRDQPFVRVNCASIPPNLSESELFGYEEGAFSGAKKGGKPGKFELANGGTIFLDEINELSYSVQAKLLRVLQEGEIERVGGTEVKQVDIRVISATGSDLRQLVEEKLFRKDLYYRLNVFISKVPPLRDRIEDLPLLCEHFIDSCNHDMGISIKGIDKKAMDSLQAYSWPGNVRELKNIIERACISARSGLISTAHLPGGKVCPLATENTSQRGLESYMANAEREIILKTLNSVRWNRNETAKLLSIHRTSLYAKMKKYGLLNE
jgi:transcriptional regulator with PAS, ATPase and Fis domain